MSRAPILLALIGLLALLIGGLWWGLGLGSGTLQAAAGTQEETELAQAAGSVLSSEDPGARRSELAPVQQPEENNAAPSEPKLRPSGRLVSGRVLDVMGAPVAQAEVYALAGEGQMALPLELEPEFWPGGRPRILRTQTDAQGRYAFHGPSLRELRVMARKPGMLRAYLPKRRLPQLKDELELDPLVLEPVASKQGEVRAMDGSAIAGASILRAIEALHPGEPVALEGAAVPITTSGADGRFALEEEAAGPWALWAEAEGFLPARLSGEDLVRDQVVFRLEPGLTLRGEVIALNGASLPADAIVLAWPAEPESEDGEQEPASLQSRADAAATLQRGVRAALDATGKFELKGLRAGQEHLLELMAPDESATPRRVPGSQQTRVAASERHARIEIDAPLESVGTVLDEMSGQPIEQFHAWVGQPGRDRLLRTADGRPWEAHPAGRYSFLDLRANRNRAVRVRVRAPGYLEAESAEFMPQAKGRTEIPVIRLKPAPRLRVRVVRAADQQPIADARVLLETRGAEALKNLLQQPEEEDRERLAGTNYARTAADGTAWISARSDAPFHVGASARDCVPAEPVACAALQPGEDREVLIQLSAGGRVRIEVRDPSGRPVAGIGILRRLPQTGVDTEDWTQLTPELETNARGEALFVALPRGTHLFRAHEGAGPAWVSNASDAATRDWNSVAVTEGAESLLQLRVGARVVLSGTVREARRPLAGARVSLLPVTPEGTREGDVWQQARHVQTNARGEYRFEPTAAGAYRLSVLHERRAMPQVALLNLSQPAQRHDVDLDAASIAGRIVDTQGQPVAGFSINLGSMDEFAWDFDDSSASLRIANGRPQVVDLDLTRNEVRTGPDGRFAFEGVRTGVALSLSAWHEEYEHLQQELSALAPDESRTGLEFRLARASRITVKLQRATPAGPNDPWNRVSVVQLLEGGREKQRADEWLQDSTMAGALGPGRYRLVLRTQEGAPVAGVAPQEVTLEESQVAEVVFTLP